MTVAVVGAGLAGLRTVEALRHHAYSGRIVLVGDEPHRPYSRPPLSKEVLRGDADPSTAELRDKAQLDELDVDLRLGIAATSLRVGEHELALSDGTTLSYDDVVIATGATPRSLPGVSGDRVHVLRTVDDSTALSGQLTGGAAVVVVGAGFIGLEVAASARARGCDVTVVDVLPAPLARCLPPEAGATIQRLHEGNGVSFRFGTGVTSVDPSGKAFLGDGSTIRADVVVVGIGVAPATDWLADSGLTLDNGVVCDAALRAAPGVWAAGDVARWTPAGEPDAVRVEHWTNATEQAESVGRNIAFRTAEAFETVPYFWSDQYDAKLVSLGFAATGDEFRVIAGSLDEPKWTALVRVGDRLAGVVGLRMVGRVMKLRPLLAARATWEDACSTVPA